MAKRRYKFSDKKHSVGGVISTFMSVGAIALLVTAVRISFKAQGEGGTIVGSYALTSLTVAVFGCLVGILSYRESDRYYTFSFVGTLINGIMIVILAMLLVVGI